MVLTFLLVFLPPPAQACGCGGFVTDEDSGVSVQQETAAISWDGQTERIVMSMSALSSAGDAGLLIPTPAPADVELAEAGVFEELEDLIAPQVQVEYHWWPRGDDALSGVPPPGAGQVEVLEQVDLGPVEATVLSATEPDALAAWLDEHGYVMDDALASALSPYVTEGWYYVAVRLTSSDDLTGTLPPLDITFDSSAVVYPMRMSAAAPGAQQVRTYVFAEQRMARADATAGAGVELRYAGAPDPADVTNATVRQMLADGPYLTVMDQMFYDPSRQIVSDFVFERSSNGGDHRETVIEERLLTIAGLPAGPTLLVVGLLAAAGAGLAVMWRRRSRPTADEPSRARAEQPAPADS